MNGALIPTEPPPRTPLARGPRPTYPPEAVFADGPNQMAAPERTSVDRFRQSDRVAFANAGGREQAGRRRLGRARLAPCALEQPVPVLTHVPPVDISEETPLRPYISPLYSPPW